MWNEKKVLEAISGEFNNIAFEANDVCINTRNIKPANLFVAIEGGEKYLDDAFAKGAVAAIVPKDTSLPCGEYDKSIIKVEDTFKALQDLGQYKRNKTKAKYVAITGSVGKTGTKNMLDSVLSAYGKTYATSGNYNNHYGVPITLANMPEDTEYAVIELGMSAAGEISDLVKQVRPDVALITTIAECHTEFFNSIEDIAYAKSEIFETSPEFAVINMESPCCDIMLQQAKKYNCDIITFGKNADVSLVQGKYFEGYSELEINFKSKVLNLKLPIPGEHIALNTCGVLGVVKALDLNVQPAIRAIENTQASQGRGERTIKVFQGKEITIIDEAYNSSPRAVIASVKTFSLIKDGRKVLVLGDMLELGEQAKEFHLSILPSILESNVDTVYCCGEFMKYIYEELPINLQGGYAEDSEKLIPILEKDIKNGDNILLKSSKGSKVSLLVDYLKKSC